MSAKRQKLVFILFFLYFFVLLGRLFFLQIVKGKDYEERSENQREGKIAISAERGMIYSRDGFLLAENQIGYVLNFDKNLGLDKKTKFDDKKINSLVEILVNDSNVFTVLEENEIDKINKRNQSVKKYIEGVLNNKKVTAGVLYKKISSVTQKQINDLEIDELFFTEENLRRYPESSMSAHILGFVGRDDKDNLKGYFGLEGYYDRDLSGLDGYKIYEKDPLGKPILLNLYEKKEAINGRSLIISIDRSAQNILEKWLDWGVQKYQASGGSAILYDPWTGEILALANNPSFDPNNYYLFESQTQKNQAVSDEYEPGSIMKPLVMSMALNERLVNPDTPCPVCEGAREVSGYLIKTFDENYLPNLTMHEILERSDNTGMTYVSELLGKTKMLSYFEKLGFGELTRIDLEGEAVGYVKKPENIYAIDQATMAFGQGISVNSIQMVKAWGAIATGSTVSPHVVTAFLSDKETDKINLKNGKRIFTEDVVKQMTKILVNVAKKSPLRFASDKIPNLKQYQIAAKSGTAQIPVGGKYAKDITVGSAIGFVPVDRPKFILLVKLDETKADIWGANTAGPVFFNILNDLLVYYNIPPQ